jgi:hypothetical protein
VDNRVADALSRKTAHSAQCNAISLVVPAWIKEVVEGYQQDTTTLDIIAKLTTDDQAVPNFTLQNGVLRLNGRIWIGSNPSLQLKLMKDCHDSALGGHFGASVTYRRMKQLFAWKGMKAVVLKFVQICVTCQ